jgi:hypothetical protein
VVSGSDHCKNEYLHFELSVAYFKINVPLSVSRSH